MNTALLQFYNSISPKITEILSKDQALSHPHYLYVPDGYLKSTPKVMIVGQQPYEWGRKKGEGRILLPDGIETLQKEYEDFGLGEDYTASPFWQAVEELNQAVKPEGNRKDKILWNNLIKIDRLNKRPAHQIEVDLGKLNILQEEVKILNPDVIVFFVGPAFYEALPEWTGFHNLGTITLTNPVRENEVDGRKLFFTYHPNYLRRKGKWDVVKGIAAVLR